MHLGDAVYNMGLCVGASKNCPAQWPVGMQFPGNFISELSCLIIWPDTFISLFSQGKRISTTNHSILKVNKSFLRFFLNLEKLHKIEDKMCASNTQPEIILIFCHICFRFSHVKYINKVTIKQKSSLYFYSVTFFFLSLQRHMFS